MDLENPELSELWLQNEGGIPGSCSIALYTRNPSSLSVAQTGCVDRKDGFICNVQSGKN